VPEEVRVPELHDTAPLPRAVLRTRVAIDNDDVVARAGEHDRGVQADRSRAYDHDPGHGSPCSVGDGLRPGWPQEERCGSAAIPTSAESLIDVFIAGAHAPRGEPAPCGEPQLGEDVLHVVLGRAFE
jgi:hypothetical protein